MGQRPGVACTSSASRWLPFLQPHWCQSPRPGSSPRSPEALWLVRETWRRASLWSSRRELRLASCGWLLALGPCPTVRGGGGRTESGQLALSTHAPGPSHLVASLPSQAPLSGPGPVPLGKRGLGHPRLMGTAHLNDPEVLATPCTPRPLPREAAGTAACRSKPELEGRMERCINRIIIITAGLSDLQLSGCLASPSPPIALGTGHP